MIFFYLESRELFAKDLVRISTCMTTSILLAVQLIVSRYLVKLNKTSKEFVQILTENYEVCGLDVYLSGKKYAVKDVRTWKTINTQYGLNFKIESLRQNSDIFRKGHWLSVQTIEHWWKIFCEYLNMRRVYVMTVPRVLSLEEKEHIKFDFKCCRNLMSSLTLIKNHCLWWNLNLPVWSWDEMYWDSQCTGKHSHLWWKSLSK